MPLSEIHSMDHVRQACDYTGMRFGTILPTDIDAFIDFQNRLFIFIEAKYHGKELPLGQRLALERICDGQKVRSFVLVVSHERRSGESIILAETDVVKYRYRGRWITPERPYTCREMVDEICSRYLGVRVPAIREVCDE